MNLEESINEVTKYAVELRDKKEPEKKFYNSLKIAKLEKLIELQEKSLKENKDILFELIFEKTKQEVKEFLDSLKNNTK